MSDDHDLVIRLLTLAGAIMEDTSAIALLNDAHRTVELRIAAVQQAGVDVLALAQAADVVARHFQGGCD